MTKYQTGVARRTFRPARKERPRISPLGTHNMPMCCRQSRASGKVGNIFFFGVSHVCP